MDSKNNNSSLPTAFVLVPGGFSLPALYEKVIRLLTEAGQTAVPVHLPSVGRQFKEAHGHAATMYDDAKHINDVAALYCDKGYNVVITANSYGGFVMTEAAKGLTRAEQPSDKSGVSGALIGLVYLASVMPEVGQNIMDIFPADAPNPTVCADDPELLTLFTDAETTASWFCSELTDKDERARYGAMHDVHSLPSFAGKITHAGYEYVPTTYVVAARDKTVSPKYQHETVDNAIARGAKNVRKIVLEGDHFLMTSCPKEVVEILLQMSKQE